MAEERGENVEANPVLYFIPGSYFSQIGLLSLHEKRAKYTTRFLKLSALEHMQPWFLKLNPKGEIPVLQHEGKAIPGTDLIFLYLDDHFSNDTSSRFLPKDTELRKKVERYDELLRTVKNGVVTFGLCFFPELSSNLQIPEYERKIRTGILESFDTAMDQFQKRFPESTEIVNQKKEAHESMYPMVTNKDQVKREIERVDDILEQIESELASHSPDQHDWWLCCELFTTADVILAVLLQRLELLGLLSLLDPTKKPNLCRYKERLYRRPTFQEYLADLPRLHREFQTFMSK